MNRLPPIGNASLEKYTSLGKTIISSFYGQLINGTIYLSESNSFTVFRLTTFEEFNDLNSFWDRSPPPPLPLSQGLDPALQLLFPNSAESTLW